MADFIGAFDQGTPSTRFPIFDRAGRIVACAQWSVDRTWTPQMEPARRERMYGFWKKAVTRSFDWLEE